jgi:hypothetical protein
MCATCFRLALLARLAARVNAMQAGAKTSQGGLAGTRGRAILFDAGHGGRIDRAGLRMIASRARESGGGRFGRTRHPYFALTVILHWKVRRRAPLVPGESKHP